RSCCSWTADWACTGRPRGGDLRSKASIARRGREPALGPDEVEGLRAPGWDELAPAFAGPDDARPAADLDSRDRVVEAAPLAREDDGGRIGLVAHDRRRRVDDLRFRLVEKPFLDSRQPTNASRTVDRRRRRWRRPRCP